MKDYYKKEEVRSLLYYKKKNTPSGIVKQWMGGERNWVSDFKDNLLKKRVLKHAKKVLDDWDFERFKEDVFYE